MTELSNQEKIRALTAHHKRLLELGISSVKIDIAFSDVINELEADDTGTDLQSLDSEANSRQTEAPSGAGEKGRL